MHTNVGLEKPLNQNRMKQTAVEFLEEQMLLTSPAVYKLMKENGDWQQAKEMETEQNKKMYSEEEVMDMFDELSMHLPLHYEFLVREMFKKK